MVCGKIEVIINAMVASCLSPQEIADKAGVSVSIVYRVRKTKVVHTHTQYKTMLEKFAAGGYTATYIQEFQWLL